MSKDKKDEKDSMGKLEELFLKSRTIMLYGEINQKVAREFCTKLQLLASESDDDITVYINSPGGHVESGDSIHDMIRFVKPRVKVVGTGWVASAGALIYAAPAVEDRFSLPNTRYMLHQPSGGVGGQASDISIEAEKQFRRAGIRLRTGTKVEGIAAADDGVTVTVSAGGETETLTAETVLVAIGFAPNSENLGLEEAGVATERGHIAIDDRMQTSVPNIYAIGDVTGKLGLAHVASAQGIIAAEAIAGRETPILRYEKIPRCTYAYPEVASVGLTERQARERGYEVVTAQFPFQPNGKALAMNDNIGFVKLVGEAQYGEVLGVHLIGGHVTELIAGPTGMLGLEATAEDLARTVHPHPTLSEVVMEAAHALAGQAIHL